MLLGDIMFGIFKRDPVEKMRKEFSRLSEQAIQAQRNGNIALYSELTKKADDLMDEIEKLEKEGQE
jgi:molybdenum-dependent DNA-binding transcriptional regulator ModE